MSSNYQQKKMMNALGAIDTKGNIVLEQFQDGTALLFQPGNQSFKSVMHPNMNTITSFMIRIFSICVYVLGAQCLPFIMGSFLPFS